MTLKKKLQMAFILWLIAMGLVAVGYLIGSGPVIILIVQFLMLAAQRYWAKTLNQKVMKSHEVLGKNQMRIMRRISQVEETTKKL